MGGNFEFDVDVSSVACGCVAGAYAVKIEGDCNLLSVMMCHYKSINIKGSNECYPLFS